MEFFINKYIDVRVILSECKKERVRIFINIFFISYCSIGVVFIRVGVWWIYIFRGCRVCWCLSIFIYVYVIIVIILFSFIEICVIDLIVWDWFFLVVCILLVIVIFICLDRIVWLKKLIKKIIKYWMYIRDNVGNFN